MIHATRATSLKRDLVLVAWNSNGLIFKIDELRELLARMQSDVLLVNETHMRPHNQVRLPNYVFHRDDRVGRADGGTAIAVKTCIGHHCVVLPPQTHLEATAVELPGALSGVLLVSAYKPLRAHVLDPDLDTIFGADSDSG